METQELLQRAEELLKVFTESTTRPEENRMDVYITADNIKPAVKALLIDGGWGYLSAITGLDCPDYEIDETTKEKVAVAGKGHLEALYHFCEVAAVVTLRVQLPYDNPHIESICDLIPSVSFFEREAMELLGINFDNTPITAHLILPDSWPEGVYPLRKTFRGLDKEQKGNMETENG